jgi:hypothetical protein
MSGPESNAGADPAASEKPGSGSGTDDEAWALVVAAWEDEAAHRRYLARFTDFDGLAVAGRRYKAVLDARPKDEVAQRMRADVVKKATAYGLAALPRTPPPTVSPLGKRIRMGVALSLGSVVAWLAYKLLVLLMGAF